MNSLQPHFPIGSVAALAILLAGCSTTSAPSIQGTLQQLDAIWAAEDATIRRDDGGQVVAATQDQAARAARQALVRLGMTPATSSSPAIVTGSRLYSKPGYSWTPAIRAVEEPRVRQVLRQSIGSVDAIVATRSSDEVLTATVLLASSAGGQTSVMADFRSDVPGVNCANGCVAAMPPAAYRQTQLAFWQVFRAELTAVIAADQAKSLTAAQIASRPAKPKLGAKKSSGWVLPSSGWKTPPKEK